MFSLFSKIAVAGILIGVPFVVPLWGCDSSARTTVVEQAPVERVDPSRAMESCSTSSDCMDGLRCVESQCRAGVRSRLGDFRAAEGRLAITEEKYAEAAAYYNVAVTQYENENVALPVDILCEQGSALALARGDLKLGEAAARVLHRCLLMAPPSSSLARNAQDSLVSLRQVGLDSEVLTRSEIADLYLSGQAIDLAPKEMVLVVSDDGKAAKKRGFNALLDGLKSPATKVAFENCWVQYRQASKAVLLKVNLPFSFRYVMDEDDEARDKFLLTLGEPEVAPVGVAESAAAQCVVVASDALTATLGKTIRDRSRWKSTITIQMSE